MHEAFSYCTFERKQESPWVFTIESPQVYRVCKVGTHCIEQHCLRIRARFRSALSKPKECSFGECANCSRLAHTVQVAMLNTKLSGATGHADDHIGIQ